MSIPTPANANKFSELAEKATLADDDLFALEDSVGGNGKFARASTLAAKARDKFTSVVSILQANSPYALVPKNGLLLVATIAANTDNIVVNVPAPLAYPNVAFTIACPAEVFSTSARGRISVTFASGTDFSFGTNLYLCAQRQVVQLWSDGTKWRLVASRGLEPEIEATANTNVPFYAALTGKWRIDGVAAGGNGGTGGASPSTSSGSGGGGGGGGGAGQTIYDFELSVTAGDLVLLRPATVGTDSTIQINGVTQLTLTHGVDGTTGQNGGGAVPGNGGDGGAGGASGNAVPGGAGAVGTATDGPAAINNPSILESAGGSGGGAGAGATLSVIYNSGAGGPMLGLAGRVGVAGTNASNAVGGSGGTGGVSTYRKKTAPLTLSPALGGAGGATNANGSAGAAGSLPGSGGGGGGGAGGGANARTGGAGGAGADGQLLARAKIA